MWILEYPRNNRKIQKWLHPNNTYQIGRINNPNEHEIHLNELYISKKHMIISVGSIALTEVTNPDIHTPLKIIFQSRARTSVNDKVYQVKKDDPAPIEVDSLTQESELEFQFKSGTDLRVKLIWVPLNIGRLKASSKDDIASQRDTLKESLLQLFNRNIDIRIVQDFQLVTHLITPSDEKFWFGLAIALSRGVAIVGTEWPSFVLQNIKSFERWLYPNTTAALTASLLPSTYRSDLDCKYYLPDPKRKNLLNDVVIFSISRGEKSDYGKLLAKWVNALGGIIVDLSNQSDEQSLVNEINKKKATASKFFVMVSANPTGDETSLASKIVSRLQCSPPINPNNLYDSVANVSIDNLVNLRPQSASSNGIPTTSVKEESISPKKRRLGSRKVKKVDRLAFFDFESIPTQSQRFVETSEAAAENREITSESPERLESRTDGANTGIPQTENSVSDQASGGSGTTKVKEGKHGLEDEEDEEGANSATKRQKTGATRDEDVPSRNKHDIEIDDEIEQPIEKKQKIGDTAIGPFIPKLSLQEAIQLTKSKATDAVREELGMYSQEIDKGLTNLAIVEVVDMPLRKKPEAQQSTSNAWKGRKNFKQFKKNIPLKSRVSRSFVQMDAVNADAKPPGSSSRVAISLTMEEVLHQEELNRRKSATLSKDFNGAMDDINGYKPGKDDEDSFSFSEPHNSSQRLFVSEDSQSNDTFTETIASSTTRNSGGRGAMRNVNDDDDDDDSDDDQPKFGFSRRY